MKEKWKVVTPEQLKGGWWGRRDVGPGSYEVQHYDYEIISRNPNGTYVVLAPSLQAEAEAVYEVAEEADNAEKAEAELVTLRTRQARWQPIATAPKDRTLVLVGLVRDGILWRASDAVFQRIGWYTKNGESCHWATHWTPLPAAVPNAPEPKDV